MRSAARVPAWKAILWILGVLVVIGALVYPLMHWQVEQRALECGQSCSKKGFTGYYYTPPEGYRFVRQDKCECVNIK